MRFTSEEIELLDGRKLVLRFAKESDAQAMIDYMKIIAEETHYLLRYPEEVSDDLEKEIAILKDSEESDHSVFLTLFDDEKVVGNCGIFPYKPHLKTRHRCSLCIAIRKEYWGLGLGSLLIDRAFIKAKELGYSQIELGAFSDNEKAIALYKRKGFIEYGRLPKAFLLKDGTYLDEIEMIRFLN